MKKFYLVLFACVVTAFSANAQCMLRPITLSERIIESALIIEGRVESSRMLWDDLHRNIYTIYNVIVLSNFKGVLPGTSVQVLSQGGSVGDLTQVVTNTPDMYPGQLGMFTLIPTNDPVASQGLVFEPYAGPQGVINYDLQTGEARAVFDNYASVQSDLRPLVATVTGISQTSVTGADVVMQEILNQSQSGGISSFTAALDNFTPTTITAGTNSILTINGSGFGATRGTSTVQFRNANDGGATYINQTLAAEYVAWSDNQIQVRVPTGACTGTIRVAGPTTFTSATSLNVTYNVSNFITGGVNYFGNMININSRNGYTFQYQTDFAALTTTAAQYFTTIKDQWVCNTGVNWQIGANTAIDAVAFDNVSVIRFDNGAELGAGILGQCSSWLGTCSGVGVLAEIDMSFDDGTSFYYGTGASGTFPGQIDFHSVALHEMGHGHQIGHINDATATMHYSIGANQAKRVLTAASDLAAASNTITRSVAAPACGYTVMLPLTCVSQAVTLGGGATTIPENGGSTTITASIPARYYRDVTATLARTGTATAGVDYSSTTSLVVPIGLLAPVTTVTVAAIDDAIPEGNETAIFDISAVTNGTENGAQQRTIIIQDNEIVSSNVNSIRAIAKDCRVALAYTYLGSADASELILERSKDEINWERLQAMRATGVAGSEQNINWNDNFPAKGSNFYRVRRVYATTESVSNIGRAMQTCNTPISITPNPAQDFIMVQGVSGIYTVAVFTADGKNIMTLQNVTGSLRIDIKSIAAGRYFVRLQSNEGLAETLNFIKQ